MSDSQRIPCKYRNHVLMPMLWKRARKYVNQGKAKICWDRKLKIHYLRLNQAPSGFETQQVTLGLDPGSVFDGVSIVSDEEHHCNYELIHRSHKRKNAIKAFKTRQATSRRVRRSRLWHRPCRFENRTSGKLTPTIRAQVDFRKWLISSLCKYYPISIIVVEDVKFNHYKNCNGKSFSLVEQGKGELYRWIKSLGVKFETCSGVDTYYKRTTLFSGTTTCGNNFKQWIPSELFKSLDKGEKSFCAHCLDSYVIAGGMGQNIIQKVRFVEKIVKQRRKLTRLRKLYKGKWKYFRYGKNGVINYFTSWSNKYNLCRVKKDGNVKANHGCIWDYIYNGVVEKFKCNTARYGGTTLGGLKFFYNNEWNNRVVEVM